MTKSLEMTVLETNSEYIFMDDHNADIHTLDQVIFNQNYTPVLPHIINTELPRPVFSNLTVNNIRQLIPPPIVHIIDTYGLVVCGGYLYKLFIENLTYEGNFDIDLFIVDSNRDPIHLSEKVDNIISYLVNTKHCQFIKQNRNIFELIVGFEKGNIIEMTKVQIILSIYDSPSQIIHGFDLGSCAVAFDGRNVYFTTMGKFAYEFGFNIIAMNRRSDSYEYRLRKYFKRGFGIIMPDFKLDSDKSTGILDRLYEYLWKPEVKEINIPMPSMEINNAIIQGNCIYTNPANLRTVNSRKSDYDDVKLDAGDIAKLAKNNYHIASSGDTNSLISIQTPDWGQKYIKSFSRCMLNPKISYNKLDTLQNKLVKEILSEYCDEDPNILIQKRVEKISNQRRNHLEKNGYSFNFIKPDHQQYGQFNAVNAPTSEWYGRFYKKINHKH